MPVMNAGFIYHAPASATYAYGCRAIANQGGRSMDVVHDRQTYVYETQDGANDFVQDMNKRVGKHVANLAQDAVVAGELRHDEQVTTIFDDGELVVQARLAGGYCYIGAWRRADVPTEVSA